MSIALSKYRVMEFHLAAIRRKNGGTESPEEAAHLEKMDAAWYAIPESEREALSKEPDVGTMVPSAPSAALESKRT